jgi:hypothetical protein
MKAKSLSFTFIYFSESGLFKGLQAIQIKRPIKNLFLLSHCASKATNARRRFSLRRWRTGSIRRRECFNTDSDFRKENVHVSAWPLVSVGGTRLGDCRVATHDLILRASEASRLEG